MNIIVGLKRMANVFGRRRDEKGVVVYVGQSCACSEQALDLLMDEGIEVAVHKLADHPTVSHQFGAATPIVLIDGRVRFSGKVEPLLLKRILRHREKSVH